MKHRAYINTLISFLSKIVINILSFFAGIFIIRQLLSDDYGQYTYVSNLTGIFSFSINFGLSTYFIREMAHSEKDSKDFLSNYLGLQIVLSLIALGILSTIALFHKDLDVMHGLMAFGTGMFVSSLFLPLNTILAARERIDLVNYQMLTQSILQFFLTGLGFFFTMPLIYYMFIPLMTASGRMIHSLIDNGRKGWISLPSFKSQFWFSTLKKALPFGLIMVFGIIYVSMDIIMFAHFETNHWTAVYGVSSKLIYTLFFLPISLAENLYPIFSKNKPEERIHYEHLLKKFTYYNIILCLPITIGGIWESKELIILLLGQRYVDAQIPFCIYLCLITLVGFYIGAHVFLLAIGKIWFLLRIKILGLLINFFGNLWVLIQYDAKMAMIGSAGVTLFTETFLCIFSVGYVMILGHFKMEGKPYLKLALPLGVMILFLHFLSPFPIILRIISVALIYFICVWIFGILDEEDKQRIRKRFKGNKFPRHT